MPAVQVDIHAEMAPSRRKDFVSEYQKRTKGYPLPKGNGEPYYIWPSTVNKYGWQLRIYVNRASPEPPVIQSFFTDHGKWYARKQYYRINHSQLVLQLLECGFVLGDVQNHARIRKFMRKRFPV